MAHDEAHFPRAQLDEAGMQLVFLMQFLEYLVTAHRVAVGGVGFQLSAMGPVEKTEASPVARDW